MDPERGKTRTAAGGRERLDGTLLGERRAARAGRGSWEAAALEAGHRALESAARRLGSSTGRAGDGRARGAQTRGVRWARGHGRGGSRTGEPGARRWAVRRDELSREMNAARELRELGQAVRKEEGQRLGEMLGREELGRELRAGDAAAWALGDWTPENRAEGRRWAAQELRRDL